MSGRELDADCARRLGLNVVTDYATVYGERVAISWWIGEINDESATPVLNYSSDPSATHLLEDEIERRGLDRVYIKALQATIGSSARWDILRAEPEQRARAFLAATE